jgi:hypothetical protein
MLRCVFSHIFTDFVGNQLVVRFGIRFGVGIVFCEMAVLWYFGAHLVTNFGSLGLVLKCALRLVRKIGPRTSAWLKAAKLHPGRGRL